MSNQVPVLQLRRKRTDNPALDGVVDLVDPEGILDQDAAEKKIEGWVTDDNLNPTLGVIPGNSVITGVVVFVEEAFDSDGTDLLEVGFAADPDGFSTAEDVSATGVKATTPGAADYVAADTPVEALYVAGGSAATTGRAYVSVSYVRLPAIPA